MSMLSNKEIKCKLGNELLIHPLKGEISTISKWNILEKQIIKNGTIRDCTIFLTASEKAYSLKKKKQLNPKEEHGTKYFEIPPNSVNLIWTDESIGLSEKMCGTLHSTTKLASLGIGHIGTRINPNWTGVLCVPIHNLSDNVVKIYIKDPKNPLVYVLLHSLKKSNALNPDSNARLDLLAGFENTKEILEYFHNPNNLWMMDKRKLLEDEMQSNEVFKILKTNWLSKSIKYLFSDSKNLVNLIKNLQPVVVGIITTSEIEKNTFF